MLASEPNSDTIRGLASPTPLTISSGTFPIRERIPSRTQSVNMPLERPSDGLMPYYLESFFKNFSEAFPFLRYDRTVAEYLESSMSPALANCIASLAVPSVAIQAFSRVLDGS